MTMSSSASTGVGSSGFWDFDMAVIRCPDCGAVIGLPPRVKSSDLVGCPNCAGHLLRVRDGRVDIAYPFSTSPTPFVVRAPGGREWYACCAMDALGIAPMLDQPVQIRSRCHHCGMPLDFSAGPSGPGPDAQGIMLWIGKRGDYRCKVADSL